MAAAIDPADATAAPAPADLAATALTLARCFAAGATMWCAAPAWPGHARHLAVEFVHPVVVGTRALPAVALHGADLVDDARSLAAVGDILVAVGPAADPTLRRLLPRARAWGLTTVLVGAGPRPAPRAADHVLWVDAPADDAAHDGRLVLAYHLLWELTHVCFEHPGLLRPEPAREEDVCTTCSDEGRAGEVLAEGPDGATVRTARGAELVDVTLVAPVVPGDLVLIHAGTAITRLPESP
jgi:hypothetical protein